jgi:hypothetical protein
MHLCSLYTLNYYYAAAIGMFTAMATLAMARPAKSSSVLNLCLNR